MGIVPRGAALFLSVVAVTAWELLVLRASAIATPLVQFENYPVPYLSVFTAHGFRTFHTRRDVYFDLSYSFHPNSTLDGATTSTPLYFLLQLGDRTGDGRPWWKLLSSVNSVADPSMPRPLLYTHAYETAGRKVVNVTVSDQPFIDDGAGIPYGVLRSGQPPPVLQAEFDVFQSTECYQFDVNLQGEGTESDPRRLILRAVDPHDYDGTGEWELTRTYASIGELPVVRVDNFTHSYTLRSTFDSDMAAWTCDIPWIYLESLTPVMATIVSLDTAILDCTIADMRVDISRSYFDRFTLGYDVLKDSVETGLRLKTSSYRPSTFRLAENYCMREFGLIALGAAQTAVNYTGAIVILSSDLFHKKGQVLDLLRTPGGARIPSNETLCQETLYTACETLTIKDTVFIRPYAVFLTNVGIFRSSDFIAASGNSFLKLSVRTSLSPNGTNIDFALPVALHSANDCLIGDHGFLYLLYTSAASAPRNDRLLITESVSLASNGQWISGPLPSAMTGVSVSTGSSLALDSTYSFVSAIFDYSRNEHILLMGKLISGCCGLAAQGQCCFQQASIWALPEKSNAVMLTYVFPVTSVVVGMAFHDDALELFIYGSELWKSTNGMYFHQTYALPAPTSASEIPKVFTTFTSSRTENAYYLMSNTMAIYFGKASADHVVKLNAFSSYDPNLGLRIPFLRTVVIDEVGQPRILQISTPFRYPTDTSAYPAGFLKYANGTMLSIYPSNLTQPSLISKQSITFGSFLRTADTHVPSTLVPTFISQDSVRFYVYDDASAETAFRFQQTHREMIITPKIESALTDTTPRALILQVSEDGLYADASILIPLTRESPVHNSAVWYDLVVSNLTVSGSAVPPVYGSGDSILFTTTDDRSHWLGVIVTLTSNSVRTSAPSNADLTKGWQVTDIGKTVVVHGSAASGGSILLTHYLSPAVMYGRLVKRIGWKLSSSSMAVATSASFRASEEWSLYDFRSWKTFQDPMGVSAGALSLATLANGTLQVTLSGAANNLSSTLQGYFLECGGGTAVVLRATTLIPISGTSFASGTWSIYAVDPEYQYGAALSVSDRVTTWSLGLDECKYAYLDSDIPSQIVYLSDGSQMTMSTTILPTRMYATNAKNQLRWTLLSAQLRNSEIVLAEVRNVSEAEYGMLSRTMQVSLTSTENSGFTTLSVRPKVVSLLCDEQPKAIQIYNYCPPYFSYGQELPMTMQEFLGDSPDLHLHPSGLTLIQVLPTNYRPPSPYGHSIPTSPYIYNADPSLPRYNNYFTVSQNTGIYRLCAHARTRDACGCTDYQTYSSSPNDTDCNERVLTTFFERPFSPRIQVYVRGVASGLVRNAMRVREVNGRVDWCVSWMEGCGTRLVNLTESYVDPTQNHTLIWMGSELYHFELTDMESAHCQMKTFLKVWVIQPPLRATYELMTMAITAVVFWAVTFALYMNMAYSMSN